MDYLYRAKNTATGVETQGEIAAATRGAAVTLLRSRGLLIVQLDEKKTPVTLEELFKRFRRVKPDEVAIFSREFETMISAGMSIIRSLTVLEETTENTLFQETLLQVRADVEAGNSLSEALGKYPKIFTPLYVNLVQTGEVTGKLDVALRRVADYLEKEYRFRKEVVSATRYPTVVLSFGILAMLGLITFILPRFVNIYHSLSPTAELPTLTAYLQKIGIFITHDFYIWIPLLILAIFGLPYIWKRPEVKVRWDRIKLQHIPGRLGILIRQVIFARVSRTFATLVSTGVPIMEALDIAGSTANNIVVEEEFHSLRDKVRQGSSLARPMRQSEVFPPMFAAMVAAGEESGALEEMLVKIAEFYETEVEAALKSLKSIIEPLLIVVVGVMIGTIVIGMYLPIFKVYQLIK